MDDTDMRILTQIKTGKTSYEIAKLSGKANHELKKEDNFVRARLNKLERQGFVSKKNNIYFLTKNVNFCKGHVLMYNNKKIFIDKTQDYMIIRINGSNHYIELSNDY